MKKLFILLLTISFYLNCTAQNTPPKELHFNRLTVENGLPEPDILTFIQDKYGYMWMGTQAGLVRYDGYQTKVYKFDPNDPLQSMIYTIYEDRSGELWIGTSFKGLYHYNRKTDSFASYAYNPADPNSLGSGGVSSIYMDRIGSLWVKSYDLLSGLGDVSVLNTKTKHFKHYRIEEKATPNWSGLNNFFEDSKGRLWMETTNGIYEYSSATDKFLPHFATIDSAQQKSFANLMEDARDPGVLWMSVLNTKSNKGEGLWRYNTVNNSLTIFHHAREDLATLANDSINILHQDSQGRLWLGTREGLSLFDPSSRRFTNYNLNDKKKGSDENNIRLLKEDKSGNLWCISGNNTSPDNCLLFDVTTKTFTRYSANEKASDGLPLSVFNDILIDRAGTLWLGAYGGLYWLNPQRSKFEVYINDPNQPHHYPGGMTFAFTEAKDKTFWVGSDHELYHWYPSLDSFELIKIVNDRQTPLSNIFSLITDKEGTVWCGSDKGLFRYDPLTKAIKNFKNNTKDSTSLSSDMVVRLYQDHEGTLWIGTLGGGLCRFNWQTGTFKRFPFIVNNKNTPNNNVLDDDDVISMYEDKQGTLWIGTNGGGLNRFNREKESFTSYQNQVPGFACVTSIYEDSKDRLWAGTLIGGLFLFDRKTSTAQKFTEKDGLLYDGVLGINEDNEGNVWTTSLRGISILNSAANQFHHLNTSNGLPENPNTVMSLYKTSGGRFIFACDNGFVSFNPEQFASNPNPPVIHLETVDFTLPEKGNSAAKDSSILLFGKSEVKLPYNENRITLRYVGILFQNAELTQYAYKLDGYDKDWVQAGTQRTATYTNLSPGTYTFHVKAANSDGAWSEKEDTINVIISPPWWRTWWAYLIYAVLFIAALRAYIVFRSRSLRRHNRILEEKVNHRTHQLSEANEELKTTQEEIVAQRDELAKTVTTLQSTQAQLIQSEKMASLGELTAGIAHEIQNPLNFVNNFSDVNVELLEELGQEAHKGNIDEVKLIAADIKENEQKINHHGKRADAIVKGMVQHSRADRGKKEPTDINALADEYLRISYHGLRAKDKDFNADFKTDFDESVGKIEVVPQDIGRVLLNLYNNAFYAVNEKKKQPNETFEPAVTVITKRTGDKVEIVVRDNGNGIAEKVADKIFQPFFTTKPPGQGTGLGLSLSYDIIKAHGGELKVKTKEGEGAEFIIQLPS